MKRIDSGKFNIVKNKAHNNGIVHADFRGFRAFMTRKKGRCKLIGIRLVIPHDTIP